MLHINLRIEVLVLDVHFVRVHTDDWTIFLVQLSDFVGILASPKFILDAFLRWVIL